MILAFVLVPLLSRCDSTAGEGAGLSGFFGGRFALVAFAAVVVLARHRLEMES